METYMSPRLYKAATAGDVHYLWSSTLWREIEVSSNTVSDSAERNERLRCHDLQSLTPEENNCLHIAARFGHEKYVQEVLNLCPSLVYQQNKKGDNPLHVAARAGHLGIVKLLTDSFQRLQSPREADQEEEETIIQNEENSTALSLADCVQPPPPTTSEQSQNNIRKNSATTSGGGDDITCDRSLTEAEEGERPSSPMWRTQIQQNSTAQTNSIQPHLSSTQIESTGGTVTRTTTSEWPSLPIWLAQNHEGSTALHEALRKKHKDLALYLLDLDCEQVVLVVNAKNESPLYLAAEAGFVRVLEKILSAGGSNNFVGPMGQTPLHAAVFAGSIGCIQVLHESNIPGLTRKQDLSGKTALHYATQAQSLQIMRLLLSLDASSTYIRDNEGFSPLLVATSICTQRTVKVVLHACPASIESTDNHDRNALHLAVKHNSLPVLRRLLRMPQMKVLINQPDKDGNTPLHLATSGHQYRHVRALLSTKCVDLTAKNDSGQTALDLCVLDWELTARQTMIWGALKHRKAKMGRFRPLMRLPRRPSILRLMPRGDAADLKQVANMLAVVASLLTTITFAAVLQLPGGYNADGPYMGSPSLIHKPAFKVFVIADAISLGLSATALIPLVSATRSDKAFLAATIALCQCLVQWALYTAMIAFISGLYLVLSIEFMWMAIFVCILGPIFLFYSTRTFHQARIVTPVVPGLLRRRRTRLIIREQGLEE